MRHRHGLRKLNRTSEHRLAMLRNMCNSLLLHEAIRTTLPKAKELRRVVEPLITLAKEATLANRRLAFNRTRDRDIVTKLFNELGPRYKELLADIYDHGVLPRDFSLYLHHPTVTDPSLAPEGCSTFYALAPVAHLGKSPLDWDGEVGDVMKERILDEIEHRLIPDIRSRIMTSFHYAPTDFARDLNAHLGSAFSLEPTLTQSAWFRTHNRDDAIPNLYFVGAGTHPGAGIPGVVGSAKATAALMLEDLR